MKINQLIILLLVILAASMVVSAEQVGISQVKQMMANSAQNLTTYTYSRSAESKLIYTNRTIQKEIDLVKVTNGKVDLAKESGSWNSNLTDKSNNQILTWDGYFVDSSEYWKNGQNWTKFNVRDKDRLTEDYNEVPGQINLIRYSNMVLVGSVNFQGEDDYKLVGSPIRPIYVGMLGLQLLTAYFESPFTPPQQLMNRTLRVNSTSLLSNSSIMVTAWVSKDTNLLRRLDINSTMNITPKILNIPAPNYSIKSSINESTVYSNYGTPVTIVIPAEAQSLTQNQTRQSYGADWRWAIFGSVRP